jgi:Type IV secretion-system coupling protein DNA-binding domain
MQDKVIYDWGQTPPTAPSTRRADPLGWIAASLLAGAAAAFLAMVFVWRPLPGLMGPPGSLGEHMTALWQLLAHKFWRGAYSQETRAYLAALGQLGDPERIALIWRGGLAAWAACMPSVFLFESYMTPRDSLMHMRGSMRHEGAEAIEHLNATLAGRAKRRPDHEIAPSVPYPADMWTRHVLVVGGVGSGKSTAMKPLIDKVVKAGEPLILFDPKGEFTKGFARPALIAPWDKRTCSWDVAKDMRNIGDMRRFAAAMIREGQDPMWANASRQILVGFMIYLRKTRGTN